MGAIRLAPAPEEKWRAGIDVRLLLSRKHVHKRADIHKVYVHQVTDLGREKPSDNEFPIGRTLCFVAASDIDHIAVVYVETTFASPVITHSDIEQVW